MDMTNNERGRVVVTGGSTGIGQATALHLRGLGFSVFAGVRREEDAERLRDRGVTPIRLDVTDPKQLVAARAEVGDQPLAGLVNNAGIARGGPLEFVPLDDLREQFEVNVIGLVAVTQTFIDVLRAGRGRIVNIGSLSGLLGTASIGPYVASKFALEGMTDVLRRELLQQGIDVVMVEPGAVRTPLLTKATEGFKRVHREGSPELTQRYGAMLTTTLGYMDEIDGRPSIDATVVAKVIGRALTARRPRTRYLVGRDAILAAAMAKFVPDRVMDRLLLSLVKT